MSWRYSFFPVISCRISTDLMISAAISPTIWSVKPSSKAVIIKRTNTKKSKRTSQKGTSQKGTKHKRSTKSLQEIRFFQQQSQSLIIPHAVFINLTREIGQSYAHDLSFTKNSFVILQHSIEYYLVKLLEHAQLAALHAQRTIVCPRDLQLIRTLNYERL